MKMIYYVPGTGSVPPVTLFAFGAVLIKFSVFFFRQTDEMLPGYFLLLSFFRALRSCFFVTAPLRVSVVALVPGIKPSL